MYKRSDTQKREIEVEIKKAKLIKQKPHPPQKKFIYKLPVAGKMKFRMQQERAKSPHGEKSDNEKDKKIQKGMKMSYDDWLKKKRDDSAKRREDERQKELAKSDPELDRIIPDIQSLTFCIYPYLKLAVRNYPH